MDYIEKPYSEKPNDVYIGPKKIKKLWLSLPNERDEGWIAGVYDHNSNYEVYKDPDCIDMMNDSEIKARSANDTLDLDYMLNRIQKTKKSGQKIVVHMLTCREALD